MQFNRLFSDHFYLVACISSSWSLMIYLTIKNKGKRIYVVETKAAPRKKKEKERKVMFDVEIPIFTPPIHPGPWCTICQAPLYFYERQDICLYCELTSDPDRVS